MIYLPKRLKFIFKNKNLNLHEPDLDEKDLFHLQKCFKSGMISTAGQYVDKFEGEIKKITKCKYVVSVTNGTIGLFVSLKVLNITQNDEVLVPAVSFVATANAVSHCGAVPHFVDIENRTNGIDAIQLEKYLLKNTYRKKGVYFNKKTKRPIKAIIPVHIFGHPCEINKIVKVAKRFNLVIIEDAAEALGSYYKQKHVGNFGQLGVLSFNGNKIVTTGGGGAILINNRKLYNKIKHLITTAKVNHKWKYLHDDIGYNFRLPAINAALGYSQLLKIKKTIKNKKKLYYFYKNKLKDYKDIKVMPSPKYCKSNYWLQTLILSEKTKKHKSKIIKDCHNVGIKARPLWNLISTFKMYKKCPKMKLINSKKAYEKIINVPSSSFLIK